MTGLFVWFHLDNSDEPDEWKQKHLVVLFVRFYLINNDEPDE